MKQKKVKIKGMHCKSCEMLIENKLKDVCQIKKAEVSHRQAEANIFFEGDELDMKEVEKVIREAGYEIGENKPEGFINKNFEIYKDLGFAMLLLVVIYLMLKGLGVFNFNYDVTGESLSLPIVFFIGITAGLSTCMALIGGLVLGMAAKYSENHPEISAVEKFKPHWYFQLGRLASYFLLGGLLGIVGSVFRFSSLTLSIMTLIVALVMFVVGLQLTEIFPWLNNFKLILPKSLGRKLGIGVEHKYTNRNAIILGVLTFFLPCGFTQAMQLYAVSTGSFWQGAFIMLFFALGTAPGLLGISALTAFIKGIWAKRFFKLAGLVVIVFSLINMSNAGKTLGFDFSSDVKSNTISKEQASSDPNVIIENGVQIVRMDETARGYSPNSFTIKKNLPVRWIVNAKAPYSCAASLIVPKLNIEKDLAPGENIIEFTPIEIGKINFSCSMGMYRGNFIVEK